MTDAEGVYAAPADALDAARATLGSPTAGPAERARALWVLGRSAYYANRMGDAVRMLTEAAGLAEPADLLTEILLTLAPALSKEGHPDDALRLLEQPALELEPRFAGQLRNQRAIILTELGRLPEAMAQLEAGLTLLRQAGDTSRECRTLVNLGVVASLMGQLDAAERWYALARDLAVGTGQHVVAAGIEGNLGYVESRRGDFAAALDWYERARAGFAELGGVDLLVAVLETDHARTLLDVGLFGDAADAAERAVRSAAAGGNQMLVSQSRLLLAEALLALGEVRRADDELSRGAELAERLGQGQWVLRAESLRAEFGRLPADEPAGAAESRVAAFLDAGWVREAYEAALSAARVLRAAEPGRAAQLLRDTERRVDGSDVDPIARALGALVLADLADDASGADAALTQALAALADQRDLLGSVEVRTTIVQRLVPLREAAVAAAMRLGDAPDVLRVLERTRGVREQAVVGRGDPLDGGSLARLRSARVAVDEAKLDGGDLRAATDALRTLEREILAGRRSQAAAVPQQLDALADAAVLSADTDYVTFVVHAGNLLGLAHDSRSTRLADLGPVHPMIGLARAQRASLRRLADARRSDPHAEFARLQQANTALDERLLAPLALAPHRRVVVTPVEQLRDVAWAALPSLHGRPVVLAPALSSWVADREPISVGRVALLGGLGVDAAELDAIAGEWTARAAVTMVRHASCAAAADAFTGSDLLHIAAHGAFRADNPYFSSLVFADGPLALLEIAALHPLPAVVVLASCDTAAAAGPGGTTDVVVGTASELRRLGARVVIAPSIVVGDLGAGELSIALHRALVAGDAVDAAVGAARAALVGTGDPRLAAVAWSFQVFAGAAAGEPLLPTPAD
jgi:tetratricopeptide (TPR) repeat protein